MKIKHIFGMLLLAVALVGCGSGSGSAGTVLNGTSGGSGGSTSGSNTSSSTTATLTTATVSPAIVLSLVDSSGNAISNNAIVPGALTYIKAVVTNSAGTGVANALVSFTSSSTNLVFNPASGQVLTNSSGVAQVAVSVASATIAGAATISAGSSVSSTAVSAAINVQSTAANVTLAGLAVASSPITALQSSGVTVNALINGSAATAGAVSVNFSAGCGTFSPATATSNSSGVVSTTYQSNANCSGSVILGATASGSSSSLTTASISVTAAQAANILFYSASPTLVVTSAAQNGVKQSTVQFEVVDGSGTAMSGQTVYLNLSNAAIGAGVTFLGNTTATQTVTTNASGIASVIVSSGSLPTPIIVTAVLPSNANTATVTAASAGLAVTSGVPTQNGMSLASTVDAIEAYSIDGVTDNLTVRLADRQGNPVPPGTVVNFVAGFGQTTGTCTIDTTSSCSVVHTSSGAIRGYNNQGLVTILAYTDGEESFVDLNGNNVWDAGEPFTAVGTVYRDDAGTGYAVTDQTYPGGHTGTGACSAASFAIPSVPNTCDNTAWSGNVRVRTEKQIVWSTSFANITKVAGSLTQGTLTVQIADKNGNSMPTGSVISASVTPAAGSSCALTSQPLTWTKVPNQISALSVVVSVINCSYKDQLYVTVTTPANSVTTQGFQDPPPTP